VTVAPNCNREKNLHTTCRRSARLPETLHDKNPANPDISGKPKSSLSLQQRALIFPLNRSQHDPGRVKDIYDIIAELKNRSGQSLGLATLVQAEGSSYRRPGARLLICPDGRTVGSLSGGCIEEEIAERARPVIESGEPVLVDFDTRRRFGCHGKIDIFIERLGPELFADISSELAARRKCLVVTTAEGSSVHPSTVGEAVSLPNEDRKREANSFPYRPFVQEIHPPIRLLIFGEGPDSAPLQKFCELLGWQCFEISDAGPIPFESDEWTAAIVKSHNFGRDFVALAKLLPPNLRYVGLIGPKQRRNELLNELLQIGVPMNAGFFAPAGLDLNAETPEEIALAVISEIQRVFAGGSGQSLRDRKQPIHYPSATSPDSKIGWQKSQR